MHLPIPIKFFVTYIIDFTVEIKCNIIVFYFNLHLVNLFKRYSTSLSHISGSICTSKWLPPTRKRSDAREICRAHLQKCWNRRSKGNRYHCFQTSCGSQYISIIFSGGHQQRRKPALPGTEDQNRKFGTQTRLLHLRSTEGQQWKRQTSPTTHDMKIWYSEVVISAMMPTFTTILIAINCLLCIVQNTADAMHNGGTMSGLQVIY